MQYTIENNWRVHTPLKKIEQYTNMNVYAKFEGCNITGSMKDRPANFVIDRLAKQEVLQKYDGIIESSSGNMGIALARTCALYQKKFYCVIDPKILSTNKEIISMLNGELIMVDEPDKYGGYLISRLNKVQEFLKKYNLYWFNQYDNKLAVESYWEIADEVHDDLKDIDYYFVAVSSGGSIAGISQRLKEISPKTKVVAVDVEGSVIFKQQAKERHIQGAGSSIVPNNLNLAHIADTIFIKEEHVVKKCLDYAKKNFLIGGSSGLVLAGMDEYLKIHKEEMLDKNIVVLFPDRGERYLDTIYNINWRKKWFI